VSHCPSCGQFVGPYDTCPHCGAHLDGRTALRAIKIVAVGMIAVGFLILWLLASRAEPPLVPVGQIGATMNLAYVRLEGQVSRGPNYDSASHTLAFWLTDDTGEIYIAAYRREAQDLIATGRVPALGDQVSVAGTLRLQKDFVSLTLNAAGQLQVTKPEPSERSVAEIDPYSELDRVRLRGQVRGIREPYQGLTLIGLRDATGAIEIAVPEETLALTGALPPLASGQWIKVTGTVTFYQKTPQLTLTRVTDINPSTESGGTVALQPVSGIGPEAIGTWVGVQGFVTSIDPFSAGVKLTLDDASGEITVLLWQDLYDKLSPVTALKEGTAATVYGQVAEYRGQIELLPELPVDVQLAAALPPPEQFTTSPTVSPTVTLTPTPTTPLPLCTPPPCKKDEVYHCPDDCPGGCGTVCATPTPDTTPTPTFQVVCTPPPCKKDEVYHCPDDCPGGCGTVCATPTPTTTPPPTFQVVCTPPPCKKDEVYHCPDDCPGGCGTVCATPTLAVTPSPTPTATVSPTPIPLIPTTPMGEVNANRAGEMLTVQGQVTGTANFSAGFKFKLGDDTGQIVLLLWNDTYDAIAGIEGINIGATVKVTGEIGVYEGELQITPAGPGDVTLFVPSSGQDAPHREIGGLSAADVGMAVEIEGDVSRVEDFSHGQRVYVTDGTGEVQLLLWQNVADRLPDGEKLVAGARVRANGQVEEYKGALQVVPCLPFDVVLLTE